MLFAQLWSSEIPRWEESERKAPCSDALLGRAAPPTVRLSRYHKKRRSSGSLQVCRAASAIKLATDVVKTCGVVPVLLLLGLIAVFRDLVAGVQCTLLIAAGKQCHLRFRVPRRCFWHWILPLTTSYPRMSAYCSTALGGRIGGRIRADAVGGVVWWIHCCLAALS